MTTVSPKEFGEMRSDTRHTKAAVDRLESTMSSIDQKLDLFVTREYFDKVQGEADFIHKDHSKRIVALEQRFHDIDQSVWTKVKRELESKVVTMLAGGALVVLLVVAYFSISNYLNKSPEVPVEVKNFVRQ